VTGGIDTKTYPTQAAAQAAAEADLMARGGGEVLIKGEDGRIREQNTIGRLIRAVEGIDSEPRTAGSGSRRGRAHRIAPTRPSRGPYRLANPSRSYQVRVLANRRPKLALDLGILVPRLSLLSMYFRVSAAVC
jgi:hypothetical protein